MGKTGDGEANMMFTDFFFSVYLLLKKCISVTDNRVSKNSVNRAFVK